jgi:hypothetical protein
MFEIITEAFVLDNLSKSNRKPVPCPDTIYNTAQITISADTFVFPMTLEFWVKKPAADRTSDRESILSGYINDVVSLFSFNILNGNSYSFGASGGTDSG